MLEKIPLRLLLRPANLTETIRPVLRMLNGIGDAHHRAIDKLCNRIVANSFIYPHGFFKRGFGDYSIVEQFAGEIREAKDGRRPPIVEIQPELRPTMTDKALRKEVIFQEGVF